jgi:hypothetical protein
MTKIVSLTIVLVIGLQSFAQKMKDLGKLEFNEKTQQFLSDQPQAKGLTMYDLSNMLAYGIDNNGSFIFYKYKPFRIELFSYNENIAGYGFRIMDYDSQEEIGKILRVRYPTLKMVDSSRFGKYYKLSDNDRLIDFRTVSAEAFKEGRNGYLLIMSHELSEAIAREEKKYQKKYY